MSKAKTPPPKAEPPSFNEEVLSLFASEADELRSTFKALDMPYETLQDLYKLPKETLESVYATGYSLYKNGQHKKASAIFLLLTLLNPFQSKYWMGLGATRQLERKYEQALRAFAMAAILDNDDPRPHLYSAECYVCLDKAASVRNALREASKRKNSTFATENIKHKIELMKKAWKNL